MLRKALWLAIAMGIGTSLAGATGITYTCDSSVDATAAGTCAYLNSTIAGLYGGVFENATANIYIEQGITSLGGVQPPRVFFLTANM